MNPFRSFFNPFEWALEFQAYMTDCMQRSVLFWDVMRKRGNNYLEHLRQGQPPVLIFDYEEIMDARTFERPVNYALLQILDRRGEEEDRRRRARGPMESKGRRLTKEIVPRHPGPARPIVVIDPRAGHGPGIGGSKLNSQIGVALDLGHPVYFVMFFTDPEPGQTIQDVQQAEITFLEEVARRHPDAPKPAVIGNCQAGWAAALIGADRPDVAGPMVLTGSPLSYWGGVEGANPMRYRGGLCGGTWLTSLWCDLGNGKFDGAHLVAGFEDLNPANTFWSKQYHLYANVDTEEERYLNFEKWWGGFFKMNTEEIHYIVDCLFVGNELEQGRLELEKGKMINLKNFREPILVFASGGDNITPPPQALNWIYKVYRTVDEIKRCGQVIVYMVHEKVGHLGIFVSASVAKKEHREIIGCMDMLDYLSPGLYEMVIEGEPSRPWLDDYRVRFEERDMADILDLDDGFEDEEAFYPVRNVSRYNDWAYQTFLRPWVQLGVNEFTADCIRNAHALRVQRYAVSDLNPWCWPLQSMAQWVRMFRQPATADNTFLVLEKVFSGMIETGLNWFRDMRDLSQEACFKALYGNTISKQFFQPCRPALSEVAAACPVDEEARDLEKQWARKSALTGGFAEAAVRIMIAVTGAGRMLEKSQFQAAQQIVQSDRRLKRYRPSQYKAMVKEQARILQLDPECALKSLLDLLPTGRERADALAIAQQIARSDHDPSPAETRMIARIQTVLGLDPL